MIAKTFVLNSKTAINFGYFTFEAPHRTIYTQVRKRPSKYLVLDIVHSRITLNQFNYYNLYSN